jgi:hypothetical protein
MRTRYPLDRRLSASQSRSGRCEEKKNLLPLPRIELRPYSPYWPLYLLSYPEVTPAVSLYLYFSVVYFKCSVQNRDRLESTMWLDKVMDEPWRKIRGRWGKLRKKKNKE